MIFPVALFLPCAAVWAKEEKREDKEGVGKNHFYSGEE
jgi:hypothetical protein